MVVYELKFTEMHLRSLDIMEQMRARIAAREQQCAELAGASQPAHAAAFAAVLRELTEVFAEVFIE